MAKHKDLTGEHFSNYVVQRLAHIDSGGNTVWECLCELCGGVSLVRRATLLKGSKSCIHCKTKHRKFPCKTLCCNNCDKPVTVPSNRYTASCSEKCRSEYLNKKSSSSRRASVEQLVKLLFVQSKSRAKRLEKEFDLTVEFLLELLSKQDGKCAGTGRKLLASSYVAGDKHRAHRDTVSIDRIDSTRGYTKDNVQLVTYHFNIAKGAFTLEELKELCRDVVNKEGKISPLKEGRVHEE